MKRLLLLVEGQTEETFVTRVLQPHLEPHGVWCTPTILETRHLPVRPRDRGGVSSWHQVRRHLERLLEDTGAWTTTLLDFYGLPSEFPGRAGLRRTMPAEEKAKTLEAAMHKAVRAARRFIPFFAVHELEAWVFSRPAAVASHFGRPALKQELEGVRRTKSSPEELNDGPATHPSRRLQEFVPTWKKATDGPLILESIGISAIASECPHFRSWIHRLERLGR